MAITARINGEDYTGPTLAEIIDREYGAGARPARATDPNRAEWGQVIRQVEQSTWEILGTISWVEGDPDVLDVGRAMEQLATIATEIDGIDQRRRSLVEDRDQLIRRLLRAGSTSVSLQHATGLSRSQIDNIRRA